jgi:pimeloyl-ACP methyl ester carboxylesterase
MGLGRLFLGFAIFVAVASSFVRADDANMLSEYFNANGVKIHYIRAGQGEPVVLIHGLYASAKMNWQAEGTFALLAKDHDVIALDLPGHGESDKPDDAAAYGLQMVEDVRLLMDHLGIRKAHIVGYSLGGLVAIKFIALHPDRVISGTLGGMGYMDQAGYLPGVWEQLGERPRLLGGFGPPRICVSEISRLAMTKDELLAIKAPMEIIIGEKDPVRKLYVDPLLAVRHDWPVVVVPGAGHIACVTKPAFKAELARWIEANRQP